MASVARVEVEPLRGIDAEVFAASLRRMYAAWSGKVVGEEGVHRLVQRSPLDEKQRRQTSFARVTVDGRTCDDDVRTYVTFPYHRVKDNRTGRETEDVSAVMGGNLSLVRDDG
jgi:protein subunit release factor B